MPSRQSMAASPAAETMTTSSDSTTRGSTWAAASLILRESSATRETRSPVPVTSMRWDSKLSAERSEEHTSELQSRFDLVCRLLLEKTNITHHVRVQYT